MAYNSFPFIWIVCLFRKSRSNTRFFCTLKKISHKNQHDCINQVSSNMQSKQINIPIQIKNSRTFFFLPLKCLLKRINRTEITFKTISPWIVLSQYRFHISSSRHYHYFSLVFLSSDIHSLSY